jgi:hypothetical protein
MERALLGDVILYDAQLIPQVRFVVQKPLSNGLGRRQLHPRPLFILTRLSDRMASLSDKPDRSLYASTILRLSPTYLPDAPLSTMNSVP